MFKSLRQFAEHFKTPRGTRSAGRLSGRHRPLRFEPLEPRQMLTVLVTNTNDTGSGSLRQAILDANAAVGGETIEFQIPASDPNFIDVDSALNGGDAAADAFFIRPSSALPALTGGVVIDGLSQRTLTGNSAQSHRHAEIVIDGSLVGANVSGLNLTGDLNSVIGLNIQNFTGNGISVTGSENSIFHSLIGVDATATFAAGNGNYGIDITGDDNVISGDSILEPNGSISMGPGNVISGNAVYGIHVSSGSDNAIAGNLIGTDWTGTQSVANGSQGVLVASPAQDTIVGRFGRNVISGNGVDGIQVFGEGTLIEGNYIGVDITGAVALGNAGSGVALRGEHSFVGWSDPESQNVISGNLAFGVYIDGTNNRIIGNLIGTDLTGQVAVMNGLSGIAIENSSDNVIGGDTPGSRNVISGNNDAGVRIGGSGSSANYVLGNYIGTDLSGTRPLGNGLSGVFISAPNNFVGGVNEGEGNLLSANGFNGVRIFGDSASENEILGNFIGTDVTGTQALGNLLDGLSIEVGASDNVIGGSNGGGNLISGNVGSGLRISETDTTDTERNKVLGNLIGTDLSGSLGLGNGLSGVLIADGASNNIIGSGISGEANLISWNREFGVQITGEGASENLVQGNLIGTDIGGNFLLGNGLAGIAIQFGASDNLIGGTSAGEGNLISGNAKAGVSLAFSGTKNNRIQGNLIGTDLSGQNPLPNLYSGVEIYDGASQNIVGGDIPEAANTIAYNDGSGVLVTSLPEAIDSIQNSIRMNRIFRNGGIGIELSVSFIDETVPPGEFYYERGTTPPDPGDPDEGANQLQNFPQDLDAFIDYAGNLVVRFHVDSTEINSEFPLFVDFYSADEDGQEGDTYLGTVLWAGPNNPADEYVLHVEGAAQLQGSLIVATATDAAGNTSEFSPPVLVGRRPLPEVGPKAIKSATSAVEQAVVGNLEEEQVPDAEGLLDLRTSQSILITDDPTVNIPFIETILVQPRAQQDTSIVHIAVGQPPDGSRARVDGIAIAANNAHLEAITSLLTKAIIDTDRLEASQVVATFWLDPVDSKFHDERGSLVYDQASQTGKSTYDIGQATYEFLPPRSNSTPDGVQGYAIYNVQQREIRVELSRILRNEEFRGGINFFQIDQTASGTTVHSFLQVVVQGYRTSGVRADRLEIVFDRGQLSILPTAPPVVKQVAVLPTPSFNRQDVGLIPSRAASALLAISSFVQFSGLSLSAGGGGSGEPGQEDTSDEPIELLQNVVQAVFKVVTDWVETIDITSDIALENPSESDVKTEEDADTTSSDVLPASTDDSPGTKEENSAAEDNLSDKVFQNNASQRLRHDGENTPLAPLDEWSQVSKQTEPAHLTHIYGHRVPRESTTTRAVDQAFDEMFRTTAEYDADEDFRQTTVQRINPLWWSLSLLLLPSGLFLSNKKRGATTTLDYGDNDVRR